MGLISRVSSRTYRNCQKMVSSESKVEEEYEIFAAVARNRLREIEKSLLRPVQQKAFLCAAQCASDMVTEDHQTCVNNCFQRFYKLEQIFVKKHDLIIRAVNECGSQCQPNDRFAIEDSRRKQYYSCLGSQTQTFAPLVHKVLDDLANSLK